MLHVCAARDCIVRVPLKMLMCRTHWNMVPKDIQDRVWSAWRARQRRNIGERGTIAKLREAQLEAVAAVNFILAEA